MTRALSILGSTGSIGRQALCVAEEENIKVVALCANSNIDLLESQVRKFNPLIAVVYSEDAAKTFKERVSDLPIEVYSGIDGLIKAATYEEADTVLISVVGSIGLKPTLACIRQGKRVAIANKETLVCAGEIVMAEAKKHNAEIIPVDSEHSAIFQCIQGCSSHEEIKKLWITCSGGPFWGRKYEELECIKAADALKHPNWNMGNKITIDCATLMNKGLEIIEAMRLYNLPVSQVDAVIHRQSIVHSLVEYVDGAMLAQLGVPDMKLPIRYAFTFPKRSVSYDTPLDLFNCKELSFSKPDTNAFKCLGLAKEVADIGGSSCAILNAANEEAVWAFLKDRIGFNDIHRIVEKALNKIEYHITENLDLILEDEIKTRMYVTGLI